MALVPDTDDASQALQDAVEHVANVFSPHPAIVTDYVVLIGTTWFNDDGDAVEGFTLHWPHDGRTGYTNALGLIERAKRRIWNGLDERVSDD